MKNIWLLTEERPKNSTIGIIINKFMVDANFVGFIGSIRIIPILENGKFNFTYEVLGVDCKKVAKIFIKTVSGKSSFVDYLLFYQDSQPVITDKPLYAIEETKTDDKESRNTGVYQRCSKFVFIEYF